MHYQKELNDILDLTDWSGLYTYNSWSVWKHIVISILVHGNEYAWLTSIHRLIFDDGLSTLITRGKITFVVWNIEAAKKWIRYIEKDMNRVWWLQWKSAEESRAKIIAKQMTDCDICIDIHSTKKASEPFVIVDTLHDDHKDMLELMPCSYIVYDITQLLHGMAFATYMSNTHTETSLVLELWQHDDLDTHQRTYKVIKDILVKKLWNQNISVSSIQQKHIHISQAIHAKTLETRYFYSDTPTWFDQISAWTRFLFDGEKYRTASEDIYLILPSTPEYIGREIWYIWKEVKH